MLVIEPRFSITLHLKFLQPKLFLLVKEMVLQVANNQSLGQTSPLCRPGSIAPTNLLLALALLDPPARNWDYDRSFNDPKNLPPLAPKFVYLKQENFVRQYGG